MAASGGWEVVGKNSKRTKTVLNQQNNKTNKKQTRKAFSNPTLPKSDFNDIIRENSTIFDAFLQMELAQDAKKNAKLQEMNKKENKENKQQKQVKMNTKKVKNKQPELVKAVKKQSLEDMLSQINSEELRKNLNLARTLFPDTPLVWMQDLVSYLNIKINLKAQDAVFSNKPINYPMSSVPKPMQSVMNELFSKAPKAALHVFFDYLVTNCIEDEKKGLPTLAHRIVIQALAHFMPAVTLTNLEKYKELRSKYHQSPQSCLALLWAIGQGGFKSFETGLKIWLELMLPILGMRNFSQYAVDYLDTLFVTHSNIKSRSEVLGIREYFTVLDVIFSHSINLPPELQKQLFALYPKVKSIALGSNPENVLRNFFPSFLIRLTPLCSTSLRQELKSSLVMCLVNDYQCYDLWRQLYSKNLISSSLLLEHLVSQWESEGKGLSNNHLRSTLEAFVATNEEMKRKHFNAPGYKACVRHCEILLAKTTTSVMFPWRLLLLFAFLSVGGLLAYDVSSSGNFQDSKTGRFLNDVGFLAICQHGWQKTVIYSTLFYDWARENIPIYAAILSEKSRPYIQLFWEYLYISALYVVDVTADARNYLNTNIPKVLQWITDNAPGYVEKHLLLAKDVCSYLSQTAVIFWAWLVAHCQKLSVWLVENVFTGSLSGENLLRYAGTAVETLQHYTTVFYQWVNYQVVALTTG